MAAIILPADPLPPSTFTFCSVPRHSLSDLFPLMLLPAAASSRLLPLPSLAARSAYHSSRPSSLLRRVSSIVVHGRPLSSIVVVVAVAVGVIAVVVVLSPVGTDDA